MSIILSEQQTIPLYLFGTAKTIVVISEEEALENGEARFQLLEGKKYEYYLPQGYTFENSAVVSRLQNNPSGGFIQTGNYVGTLSLSLYYKQHECGKVVFEITSTKLSYREDYRQMMEDITEYCTELVMYFNSPVSQYFIIDYSGDAQTLYQRFAFVKSIIDSGDFGNAICQIIASPVTGWREDQEERDICRIKKMNRHTIKQMACSTRRMKVPRDRILCVELDTLPEKIEVNCVRETVDTPENRFVKFILFTFLTFCNEVAFHPKANDRLKKEGQKVVERLSQYLNRNLFKEVAWPQFLPLNSPVLQRKEGYREILRAWLMYDLAAKLVWKGGDDVYAGGKRDVARLYEYWTFFTLLRSIEEVFHIKMRDIKQLIVAANEGLSLQLKQGKHVALAGIYENAIRRLNVVFNYNKSFKGGAKYPKSGSWTLTMRPDYTLSIWPVGIKQQEAEQKELIVHIHFDAKYKINQVQELFGSETKKTTKQKQVYKREDVWKMHAYRDAIRRTAGAYILYPGNHSQEMRGFHEILPGIGAFAISPSKDNQGVEDLKVFLGDIVEHFLNRISQREKIAYRTYEIFKHEKPDILNELLPECIGNKRGFFADETKVLVGFYKHEKHLQWIINNKLYNTRIGRRRGSIELDVNLLDAKYLLLHTTGKLHTTHLYEIQPNNHRIYSLKDLVKMNYPKSENAKEDEQFYLIFRIKEIKDMELTGKNWNISLLSSWSKGRKSALPFTTTLSELMKVGGTNLK